MSKKYIFLVKVEKEGKQKLFRFKTEDERQFFLNQLRKRDQDADLELSISSLDLVDPPRPEDRQRLGQRLVDLAEKMRINAAYQECEAMLNAAVEIANAKNES